MPVPCRLIQDHFLVLLRHWSLFEALQFSAYVAVRLQTWHDRGRRTLQHLLVTMGYPARQYQKKYGEHPGLQYFVRCQPCCIWPQPLHMLRTL